MAFTAPPGSSGAGRRYFDMLLKKYIISIGWGPTRQRICSVSMSSDKQSYRAPSCTIHIVEADIAGLEVDAIVNAADETLLPGRNVCRAIYLSIAPELARL